MIEAIGLFWYKDTTLPISESIDKTILGPSYLHNEISYSDKTVFCIDLSVIHIQYSVSTFVPEGVIAWCVNRDNFSNQMFNGDIKVSVYVCTSVRPPIDTSTNLVTSVSGLIPLRHMACPSVNILQYSRCGLGDSVWVTYLVYHLFMKSNNWGMSKLLVSVPIFEILTNKTIDFCVLKIVIPWFKLWIFSS